MGLHESVAPLLPKLRGQFAEFLNHSSPDRLGILYLTTCVGLGYGPLKNSLEAFLGSIGSLTSPESARHHVSAFMHRGFAYGTAYTLTPAQPPAGLSYPPASPHRLTTTRQVPSHPQLDPEGHHTVRWLAQRGSSWALFRGYGNINPLSIDYASRPRLRSRLTQGGLAWPWNPWSSGGRVSHPSFATHACILTRATSTAGSPRRFTRVTRRSPTHPHTWTSIRRTTPRYTCECHSFGGVLEPRYIVGAEPLDQ